MPKGPACGMEIDGKKAARSEYNGKVYSFCCLAYKTALAKEQGGIRKQDRGL